MKKLIFTLAVSILSSCANRPESISASYISHERYINNNCGQLSTQKLDSWMELSKVSEMQNSKANGDAVGVFLLGIPFSQLSGDHEADVAKLKGEVEAIETAQIKNGCTVAALPVIKRTVVELDGDIDEYGIKNTSSASTPSVEDRLLKLNVLIHPGVLLMSW